MADFYAQRGGYYGNALQAASAGGHSAVVEMLLAKGADFNAQDGDYCNALQAASAGGHVNIIRPLLEQGGRKGVKESIRKKRRKLGP